MGRSVYHVIIQNDLEGCLNDIIIDTIIFSLFNKYIVFFIFRDHSGKDLIDYFFKFDSIQTFKIIFENQKFQQILIDQNLNFAQKCIQKYEKNI